MGPEPSSGNGSQFSTERGILSRATEFVCFHGILRNSVLGGDKGTNTAYFDDVRATVKLSLTEILPVNLVDRLYLSVAVTGDKYCIFGRVQRPQKINYYMW